ncbi:hypothetical protein [Nannocystis radixulma]|uniref:Uncharacterized protein n=1 Tax=Nannocystis radixulma TaxID=2995305 RepID=A0ABT5BG19_9BACT|nr:hypothetical protein [Nannocystis radixulma]MDC0672663.1 hypothetical protein [Nannocystis radixulma]
MRRWGWGVLVGVLGGFGCGDDGRDTGAATQGMGATMTAPGTTDETTTTGATAQPTTTTTEGGSDASATASTTGTTAGTASEPTSTTEPAGCGACSEPNQQCIDGECVTTCQGQDPDPCPMGQVCDVISGSCHAPADVCTLAGASEVCGTQKCGPGSVCDGQGACVPVAPCAGVACTGDEACWGVACACDRPVECADPGLDLLNGPFAEKIMGIDFADDCTAWMVTLRSGTDYLRRLRPDGELTEWAGVSNLDMGEVKVLRRLTIPQLHEVPPVAGGPVEPPQPVEGLGEVAVTYTCIGGCFGDIPQGVARLVEDDPVDPLPIVIPAMTTTGNGPFMAAVADAGPQGLTWGEDRVLYVGNSTANGEYNTADLELATVDVVHNFPARVTASAAVSPAHLLVALEGGALYRYNVFTKQSELVTELGAHVTGLSHDSFSGLVYASMSSLEVLAIEPFTGTFEVFAMMPDRGRVAVSPSGKLYYVPAKYLQVQEGMVTSWDLPAVF